ncbi:MAG: EamA family transporter [Clostridia bacterium]|nr:EamA family transporter [Clostridia bacterium]
MKKFAIFLIVGASIFWGFMGTFVNVLTSDSIGFTSMHLISYRTLVTGLILLGYLLIFDRKSLVIPKKHIPMVILSAILTVVVFNIAYISAIRLNGMSVASVLLYTSPVFVTIISIFVFKERLTLLRVITLICATLGCVMVSGVLGGTENLSWIGILMGLLAGLTYGLYGIFSRIITKEVNPISYITYIMLISALIVIPFADIGKSIEILSLDPSIIPLVLLFVLCSQLIPYILFTTGIKYVSPSRASITATLEPLVATIIGITVFSEGYTVYSIIGMILILGSAILLNVKSNE